MASFVAGYPSMHCPAAMQVLSNAAMSSRRATDCFYGERGPNDTHTLCLSLSVCVFNDNLNATAVQLDRADARGRPLKLTSSITRTIGVGVGSDDVTVSVMLRPTHAVRVRSQSLCVCVWGARTRRSILLIIKFYRAARKAHYVEHDPSFCVSSWWRRVRPRSRDYI